MNQIFLGDNLDWLNQVADNSIDLCYIDPPFFTQKTFTDLKSGASFNDKFDSLSHYINWLRPRIELIHKKLKDTGSFYLHLDDHAVHYVKVMLDEIFGYKNARSQIVWKRKNGINSTGNIRSFGSTYDTILFYSKSNNYTFNPQFTEHDPEYVKKAYRFDDDDGRGLYRLGDMSAPSYSPTLIYDYNGYKPPTKGWRVNLARMREMDREGLLWFPKSKEGRIQQKRFLSEMKGNPITNIWDDIGLIQRPSYPTEKPVALLERIILFSTNEGDTVLDCFAGSGTTAFAAKNLNRNYIIGDESEQAIEIIKERLR